MIKYGINELNVKAGTLSITYGKAQTVTHYPGSNSSYNVSMGKIATYIKFEMLALSEADRVLYESIINSESEDTLTIDLRYYKNVIPGKSPVTYVLENTGTGWLFKVEFIALTPDPYNVATDEVLY
jgi:hypothetical protein